MHPAMHTRRAAPERAQRAAHAAPTDLTFAPPPRYDVPAALPPEYEQLSPVSNQRVLNDQEMQSGADELSGIHASNISGADYSREQGIGRSPGWRWPWNQRSLAFNLASLDRWNLERSGQGQLNVHSGLNPYVGVPEQPYSPITAMDQYTTYYENDPDQWQYFSPGPISANQPAALTFTEAAGMV